MYGATRAAALDISKENHLEEKWSRISLLNWIGALTLSLLVKLLPRKLKP